MKISKLEKKFLAVLMVLMIYISFIPAKGLAEAETPDELTVNPYEVTETSTVDYNAYPSIFKYGEKTKSSGLFNYKLDSKGNAVITGYRGKAAKVTVPSTIDGKKVVGIYTAFANNKTVTEVVLPSSVTKIEYGAFWNATNLKNVNLNYIKYMGSGYYNTYGGEEYQGANFEGCKNLDQIVLPEKVIIDGTQFINAKMKSLTIPKVVTPGYEPTESGKIYFGKMETGALKFASGITKLPEITFKNMTVPEIVIPDSVTNADDADLRQTNAGKIVLGKGITRISARMFSRMNAVPIVLGPNTKVIGNYAFSEAEIKSLVIPDSVTEIQYKSFEYTSYLANVTFSKNLTKAMGGYEGFMNGSAWYKKQPLGVVYAGGLLYAYKGSVPKDTTINVKAGTKGIAYMALQTKDCSSGNIKNVTLPNGLVSIGAVSFFNTGISQISIPETVKEIGAGAFGNTNLKSVYIPKSVTKIGDYAFGYYNVEAKKDKGVWIPDPLFDQGSDIESRFYKNIFGAVPGLKPEQTWTYYKANRITGFKIIGYKGTAAETYAKKNGFTFVDASVEGLQKVGKVICYFTKGQPDLTFNGVAKYGNNLYCVIKGRPYTKVTGWQTINGKKYYFLFGGIAKTGWKTIGGKKYYFLADGTMKTGWKTIDGKKYYFGTDGAMVTGTKTIDGKKYNFNSQGVLIG